MRRSFPLELATTLRANSALLVSSQMDQSRSLSEGVRALHPPRA